MNRSKKPRLTCLFLAMAFLTGGCTEQQVPPAAETTKLKEFVTSFANQPSDTPRPASISLPTTNGATPRADVSGNAERVRAAAFEQGRKFGLAEGAVTHFERGLAMGKEQGRSEGREEAADVNRMEIELAVKEAVENAEEITRLQTMEEIRQTARLQEMADTNLPAYFLGTVLVCILALMLSRAGRRRDQTVAEQARDSRMFIHDVFEVAAKLIQHRDGGSPACKVIPPPIARDTDPFRFGGGK